MKRFYVYGVGSPIIINARNCEHAEAIIVETRNVEIGTFTVMEIDDE